MTTPKEFARQFVERLQNAPDEARAIRSIAEDLSSLVYSSTKEPVSLEYKLQIVNLMADAFPRPTTPSTNYIGILKEADNKRYLQLVQSLRTLLQG